MARRFIPSWLPNHGLISPAVRAAEWRYSIARNYAGLSGLIDIIIDWAEAAARSRPGSC